MYPSRAYLSSCLAQKRSGENPWKSPISALPLLRNWVVPWSIVCVDFELTGLSIVPEPISHLFVCVFMVVVQAYIFYPGPGASGR